MELINNQVLKALRYTHIAQIWNDNVIKALPIEDAPTVDAVPRDIHDGVCAQIMWERDVAMKQLEEHGIIFCGVAPDVVKVVRCKDCEHWHRHTEINQDKGGCWRNGHHFLTTTGGNHFCAYGERRTNG